jgi:hypothetical protein
VLSCCHCGRYKLVAAQKRIFLTSDHQGSGVRALACQTAVSSEEAHGYRDRADERRRGLAIDDDDTAKMLTAEETQYLGGTMERTHLVRGLDRVLLSRVRGDASATTSDATTRGGGGRAAAADAAAAAAGGAAAAAAAAAPGSFPASFATAAGRAIATAVLRPPPSSCAELFQPRRMAFVYFADERGSAEEEEGEGDDGEDEDIASLFAARGDRGVGSIPETLLRVKAECPEPSDSMNAAADAAVLREVVGVMQAVKLEAKHGKDRRKGKGSEAAVGNLLFFTTRIFLMLCFF